MCLGLDVAAPRPASPSGRGAPARSLAGLRPPSHALSPGRHAVSTTSLTSRDPLPATARRPTLTRRHPASHCRVAGCQALGLTTTRRHAGMGGATCDEARGDGRRCGRDGAGRLPGRGVPCPPCDRRGARRPAGPRQPGTDPDPRPRVRSQGGGSHRRARARRARWGRHLRRQRLRRRVLRPARPRRRRGGREGRRVGHHRGDPPLREPVGGRFATALRRNGAQLVAAGFIPLDAIAAALDAAP